MILLGNQKPTLARGSQASVKLAFSPQSNPTEIQWNSLSELNAAIDAANDGDTIDLTTVGTYSSGYFGYTAADAAGTSRLAQIDTDGKSLTFQNGTISATAPLSFSQSGLGSGIYEATLPNVVGQLDASNPGYFHLSPLVDFDHLDSIGTSDPLISVYPKPDTTLSETINNHRYDKNASWWLLSGADVIVVGGGDYSIYQLVFSGAQKTDLEQFVNASNASEFILAHTGGANNTGYAQVVSYDPSTGTLTLDTSQTLNVLGSGNCQCALIGHKSLISQDREFAASASDGKIYYRPAGAGVGNNVRYTIPTAYGIYDATPLRISNHATNSKSVTFSNVNFVGGIVSLSDIQTVSFLVSQSTSGNRLGAKVFEDCRFLYGMAAANIGSTGNTPSTELRFSRCTYKRCFEQTMVMPEGVVVEDSVAMFCERRSFLQLSPATYAHSGATQGTVGSVSDVWLYTPFETIVRRNYVNLPVQSHGQFVSAYQSTWQNCTIQDNIVVNDPSSITWQSIPSNVYMSGAGTLTITNNLMIVYDFASDGDSLSQPVIAWNYSDTVIDWIDGTQEIIIAHNTIARDPSGDYQGTIPDADAATKLLCALGASGATTLNVYKVNNIAGTLSAFSATYPQYHANNLSCEPSAVQAWGSADLANLSAGQDFSDVIDLSDGGTPTAQGTYATASSNAGPIGVLFSSLPTNAQIKSGLSTNWASTYIPTSLNLVDLKSDCPAADAVSGVDNRS